ncbi:MAG: TonB-dependent receptor [Ignavibacteriae bacterium]|nr:MAG: TonB-dependent receptor [Ignavibacteriota bacterium]
MKYCIYGMMLLLPAVLSEGARSAVQEDSVRTYQAQEMVVTATRSPILQNDSPSPVNVFTSEDIQRSNGNSVLDVLHSSEAVFMKDYGPLASLKTVSFRGMASEHILVLYDGTRLNNFQNGQVDFSLLPMSFVDRIEVVRGGYSALYGADALGGIINLISSRPSETLKLHADAAIGSFDYQRYSLDARGRVQGVGVVFGVMHDQAAGNYPYIFHRPGLADTVQKRNGADFTRIQLYLNSDYSFDDQSAMTLSLQRVKSNQGAPGSLTYISHLRQDDDAVTTVMTLRDNHLDGLSFSMNMGLTYDLQNYYSQTKTTLETFNPQLQWIAAAWDRFIVGGEFVEGRLEGMLPDAVIRRIQRSVYVSNEMFFQREAESLDRMSFYQSIRSDALSEGQHAVSPKVGINVRVLRAWDSRVRASYGKNFRMPTFNDLYDVWLGNPALKPEHSTCFDAGILTSLDRSGQHAVHITYFDITTRDRILPNAFYYPVNVAQAQSRGMEARYELKLPDDEVNAFADMTFNAASKNSTDSTNGKQLLYIPKAACSFGVTTRVMGLSLSITEMYTSQRYILEDESKWLPEYWLTDLNLSTVVNFKPVRMNLRIDVSNVFDADYQVLPGYPMPGRTFRFTAGVDY